MEAASRINEYEKHSVTEWFVRQYKDNYEMAVPEGGSRQDSLVLNKDGQVLNELVFEDPNIAKGENFNVITDAGKQLLWYNLFSLAGSGAALWMPYGPSATPAVHTDTRLTQELIADGTRPALTNQSGTLMTAGSVVALNTFVDTTFTPNISYFTAATVMGTIIGASSANVNQPVQEIGCATAAACPGTVTGTSGVLFNHYILGAPITLTSGTTIQVLVLFRG